MNGINIKYCVGSEAVLNRPLAPFSEEACAFAAELSAALMGSAEARRYPDVMSFAFWCRKANLMDRRKKWEEREQKQKRLGRGLVFHIAPSNVPVNFAFSCLFSLLAGNANLVRIPSRDFPQVALICRVMREVLENHPVIRERTAMVQYAADNTVTEQFSKMADARVIWGGDATVASIRACAAKPRCIDLAFADRYSVCVLDGAAVGAAETARLKKLAEAFYNDTYLMDQNACSSPQIIFWRNASKEAKERFWQAVFDYAGPRYRLQAASCVDKYTKLCQDAVDLPGLGRGSRSENLVAASGRTKDTELATTQRPPNPSGP